MHNHFFALFFSRFRLVCLAFLLYLTSMGSWAALAGQGVLEWAHLESDTGVLVLRGWVAPEQSNTFVVQARVLLGEHQVYQGRLGIGGGLRHDVVAVTERPQWLNSGFELQLRVPAHLHAGSYPVAVQVRTSDGRTIVLEVLESARSVHWAGKPQPSLWARCALWLAVLLPLLCWCLSLCVWRQRYLAWCNSAYAFAAAVLASLALLVAGGWTGSSLALLWEGDALVQHDEVPWLGQGQPVRTDEWLVITAMALGQFNQAGAQAGAFADVSTLLTASGHNMNVVGMTGVPVANAAAVAKPATWGFFVLPLRQALAWYWWLPFFGCFLAAWWVLSRLLAVQWRWAALLAGLLSAAPLTVGWSGWPAYVLAFALLCWGAWLRGWCATRPWAALGWGAVAGWSAAGAVLTLYPAWLLVLASLLLPLALAWLYEHRLDWRWSQGAWATLGLLLVSAVLLGEWWWHAQDAVAAMQATVYPGRRMEVGGYLEDWFLAKGLLAPVLFFHASGMVSPSDAASFVCVLLPLAGWLLWHQYYSRRWDVLANVCLLFVAWVLWFAFFGVPGWLAQLTLWSMVPVYRVDIGLFLAQTVLWALVLRQTRAAGIAWGGASGLGWLWAGTLTLACAAGAALALWRLPVSALSWVEPAVLVLSLAGYVVLCWWVLRGQQARALVLYGIWMLAAACTFNPLLQAPAQVRVSSELQHLLQGEAVAAMPRVAVVAGKEQALGLGGHRQNLALLAAGVPVSSGALYHPPLAFWHDLDPERTHEAVYNRYQHLLLEHADLPEGQEFALQLPRLDLVLLQLDTRKFDFSRMGAQVVLVPQSQAQPLRANPGLQEMDMLEGWTAFRVLR